MDNHTLLETSTITRTSSVFSRLISGGAWATSGKIINSFSVLIINVLLARMLSRDEMGAYFLIQSIVGIIGMIGLYGLEKAVVTIISESLAIGDTARALSGIKYVFYLGLLGSIVVSGLFYIGLGHWIAKNIFNSFTISSVVGLISLWINIFIIERLIAESCRGFNDIRLATYIDGVIKNVLFVIFLIICFYLNKTVDIHSILILLIIAECISVFWGSINLILKISRLSRGHSTLSVTDVLKIALPNGVTNVAIFYLGQADLWILGIFSSSADVAVYGAAKRLLTVMTAPLLISHAVLSPMIAEKHSLGKDKELEDILRTMAFVTILPAVIVASIYFLKGDLVLTLVYGNLYSTGSVVLAILCLGQLFNVWTGSCGLTLIMTGHQATMMRITLFSGIFTIVMFYIFVTHFGSSGVAWAYTIGMVIQNLFMWVGVKRNIGIWTHVGVSFITQNREWIKTELR